MATTRIMPLHIGKGRTESRAISDIIDYVANPQKTDNGKLITGYGCDSRTADAEFLLAKRQYIAATGRVRGADDVIAYHVRQSFKPGEITPEEANRLGVEFAKRFTKGNHAFVVCTHIDKSHVHNHIIWSAVNADCDRKFRNFWGSTRAVRRLSDTICIENGLSIVEDPKPHGKSYNKWLGEQAKECFFMPKYQATAYIRLSYTDDRSSESDSVTNQRKLIENFIERNPDIQIVSEKIDDGYSGIIFDRPAFKEMMQDITDGKINCVIVKDLSRLGREYIETGRYLRRVFPTYGVRFIAITDNIDTAHEGSGDDLTVSVKNIMNEAYCRDISIKTRTSLDIKRRNGDFVGAFPVYGYMKSEENKNLLVPDPYASRVVQDIFRMRLDGTSALRIATVLNEMGILSPLAYKKNNGFPYAKHGYADKEDCKWSATTIIRILQDETYIGTLVQGKQGTPHYKIKQMEQRPSSEWIRVPDAHEPLIAKQDFELVQRIRRLDTRTSPKQDTVYLFSGVLICGCCGSRMTRKTNRVKGKEYHYYYCPTGKKHGCTNPVMLKESDLVECVKDSLKGYIDNVSCLQAILDGIDQSSINQALVNEYTSHIAANEQQVEQALEFKARLYESLITGTISKEEYTDYKARYTRIAENAKESIRVLKEKLADVLENRSERNRWISHFTQFSTMETLDRKAVVHMIQSIKVIGKKELEITFTYQDEYQKAIQLIQLAEQTSQRKVG